MTREMADRGDQLALWGEQSPTAMRAPRDTRRGREAPGRVPLQRGSAPAELQDLWAIDDVADYLGVPKQTVYSWRQSGYGPRGIRVGKHLRWRPSVVVEWTLDQEREN